MARPALCEPAQVTPGPPTGSTGRAHLSSPLQTLNCAGLPAQPKPIWRGDDSWTLPVLAVGGHGVICVGSHIAGRSMKKLIEDYARADTQTAREIHQGLLPVIKALMTTAANPVPLKSALNAMGFAAGP